MTLLPPPEEWEYYVQLRHDEQFRIEKTSHGEAAAALAGTSGQGRIRNPRDAILSIDGVSTQNKKISEVKSMFEASRRNRPDTVILLRDSQHYVVQTRELEKSIEIHKKQILRCQEKLAHHESKLIQSQQDLGALKKKELRRMLESVQKLQAELSCSDVATNVDAISIATPTNITVTTAEGESCPEDAETKTMDCISQHQGRTIKQEDAEESSGHTTARAEEMRYVFGFRTGVRTVRDVERTKRPVSDSPTPDVPAEYSNSAVSAQESTEKHAESGVYRNMDRKRKSSRCTRFTEEDEYKPCSAKSSEEPLLPALSSPGIVPSLSSPGIVRSHMPLQSSPRTTAGDNTYVKEINALASEFCEVVADGENENSDENSHKDGLADESSDKWRRPESWEKRRRIINGQFMFWSGTRWVLDREYSSPDLEKKNDDDAKADENSLKDESAYEIDQWRQPESWEKRRRIINGERMFWSATRWVKDQDYRPPEPDENNRRVIQGNPMYWLMRRKEWVLDQGRQDQTRKKNRQIVRGTPSTNNLHCNKISPMETTG